MSRSPFVLLPALFVVLLLVVAPAVAQETPASKPKASLIDIEDEVMCVSCNVALNIAESPQAYAQREEIQRLIDQGLTKDEIKDELVEQYGQRVLALPEGDGFELTVYLVPIAVVLALLGGLAVLVPRWRRNRAAAAAAEAASPAAAPLDPADSARLDAELAAFDR